MDAFELDQLLDQRRHAERSYLEFLRVPALSAGLYVRPAGGVDPQQPHTEDEVYYIVSGMHSRLHDVPGLARLAQRLGRRLIDIRTPPENIPVGTGLKRSGKR